VCVLDRILGVVNKCKCNAITVLWCGLNCLDRKAKKDVCMFCKMCVIGKFFVMMLNFKINYNLHVINTKYYNMLHVQIVTEIE